MGQNQPPNEWVMNCNYEKGKDCTVSAMIDGGPNNLLGTFLIVSYSVAYTTLTIVADGVGSRASMQVDNWPFVSTSICTGGACSYDQGKSAELLQTILKGGSSITVQLSTQADGMVGPSATRCRVSPPSTSGPSGPSRAADRAGSAQQAEIGRAERHVAAVGVGRLGVEHLARGAAGEHAGAWHVLASIRGASKP